MEQKTERLNSERQKAELKKAKRLALLLLSLAVATFVITLFLPANPWVRALKAISEAAMIGALADWFAVYALFRPVQLPFISKHTAIIPRNKEKIATNLGAFVQDKFLNTQSLILLFRRHQPVQLFAIWLRKDENSRRFGQYLLSMLGTILELVDDSRIQRLIRRCVHKVIDNVDLSHSGALLLDSMTKNNRHQVLLDTLIKKLLALLKKPSSREFISSQIISWLTTAHPRKAKLLPTAWLGEQSAEWVSDMVNRLLDDVNTNKQHQIRHGFDRVVKRFITELQTTPEMREKAENIKSYLKNDDAFNHYIGELWEDLRRWLKTDITREDSHILRRVERAGQWFGGVLYNDETLQASLNEHLELAIRRMTPDFSAFIACHISDTINSWDNKELVDQIEFNIGKDLQYIRINGTLVGGGIGLIIYLLSQLPAWISNLNILD